jgi:secondary thiamine-phosphate synthase enzyme
MNFKISTKGLNDTVDITEKVSGAVGKSGVKNGICLISCPGSTCGFTAIEYERGVVDDLKRALEKIAPMNENYEHCKKWGDCNGYAHVRSALINPFLAVPVEDGRLALGKWQQLVFIDFDNRPREREIIIKTVGNK